MEVSHWGLVANPRWDYGGRSSSEAKQPLPTVDYLCVDRNDDDDGGDDNYNNDSNKVVL